MSNIDYLYEFTKEEIIEAFKTKIRVYIDFPTKKDLLFIRWKIKSEQNLKKQENLTKEFEQINFGERDEIIKKFNTSTDNDEKLKFAKMIKTYNDAFKAYLKKSEKLDLEAKEIDALYEKISEEG